MSRGRTARMIQDIKAITDRGKTVLLVCPVDRRPELQKRLQAEVPNHHLARFHEEKDPVVFFDEAVRPA